MKHIILLGLLFVLAFSGLCKGHGHAHGDGHAHDANPAFKYSKQANEPITEDEILEEDIIDLPPQKPKREHHSHGHSHDHGHSHGHHGHSHGGPQPKYTKEEMKKHRERIHKIWDEDDDDESVKRNVWFQAIGATLLISAAPFFILFFIPLDNSQEKKWLMKIFLSFASGGLLGDAFLHLIPHAMMASEEDDGHGHSHSHGHSHGEGGEGHAHDMTVGLGVLSGIIAFLVVEKLVRILNGGDGHGHSHSAPKEPKKKEVKETDKKDDTKKSDEDTKKSDEKDKKSSDKGKKSAASKDNGDKKVVAKEEEHGEIKVAGFLNLFADCFHNFTDGLAIGASFAAGESVGIITTLTILLHEVPHEIGDYAILIQSGVPPMKAIMLQLLTAVGALTGCVVSLLAQGADLSGSSSFILPFTAGGFIYIATVSVIPDILEGTSTFKQSLLEIIALLAGVGMMVIIAQYE